MSENVSSSTTKTTDSCANCLDSISEESILALTYLPDIPGLDLGKSDIETVFDPLRTVVKPGGHLFLVVPSKLNGEYSELAFTLVGWLEDIGWVFKEDIIWDPESSPTDTPAYIYVYQRPSDAKKRDNIYWNRTTEEKEENEIDLSDYQGEKSKNVWTVPTPDGSPSEALVERILQLYSYKGDTVFDFHCGCDTVNEVGSRMGRNVSRCE